MILNLLSYGTMYNYYVLRGSSIGWGPRLMKRMSLVQIPSLTSCVDMSIYIYIYIIIIESNNSMILSLMYLNYNDNVLMPI